MAAKNKQRWRFTKNRKYWNCDFCGRLITVEKHHESEYCCDGRMCGCYGMPTNPVFCTPCERKFYGIPVRRNERA